MGAFRYGPQRYAAAVFYHPQFERPIVAQFLRKAAKANKTALFRVGEWTRDFEGNPLATNLELPPQIQGLDAHTAAEAAIEVLRSRGIRSQTPGTLRQLGFPASVMPNPAGECHLLDGTVILAAGTHDVMGDPIQKTVNVCGQEITFDAVGIAAVRLDGRGHVEALAAGGLKRVATQALTIDLPDRTDLALWRDGRGRWRGVLLQGSPGVIPSGLLSLTTNWLRLRFPEPMD